MKTGSKSPKTSKKTSHSVSENDVGTWLQKTDLSRLSRSKFKKVEFSSLKPTYWDKLYEDFQKSKPKYSITPPSDSQT